MVQRPIFHVQLKYERERRGWSQEVLAEKIGCDAKTVGRWESGERLPRPYHRQALSDLFGKDAEELGLTGLTPKSPSVPASQAVNEADQVDEDDHPVQWEDWYEAPGAISLPGREQECSDLQDWLKDPGCRVVAVLGMGGIGKSVLVATAATHVKEHFDCIFWRSLQGAPPAGRILKQCLGLLAQQVPAVLPEEVDDLLPLLMPYFHSYRCLVVLDQIESIMQPEQRAGSYREGYAYYGKLIRLFGETLHQSCLVLTSREKPKEVACLEGINKPVRTLSLAGIGQAAGRELLKKQGLFGSDKEWAGLIERYSGHPLALLQASEPLREVFGGSIGRFLQEDVSAFGEISDLLEQHFERLSEEEREIVYWLAIEREIVPLEELREHLAQPMPTATLLELLDSLRRRSIIEIKGPAHFTLHALIREYVLSSLIERACQDFMAEIPDIWMSLALTRAKSKHYTRETQPVPLLAPLAQRLLRTLSKKEIEEKASNLLATQHRRTVQYPRYMAENIVTLLNYAGCSLRSYTRHSSRVPSSPGKPQRARPDEGRTMRELVTVES